MWLPLWDFNLAFHPTLYMPPAQHLIHNAIISYLPVSLIKLTEGIDVSYITINPQHLAQYLVLLKE